MSGLPHQHSAGSLHRPESALQRAVEGPGPITEAILRREGFGDEAITFAMQERLKSREQLMREGWDARLTDFILLNRDKSADQMQDEGFTEAQVALLQLHLPLLERSWQYVDFWNSDEDAYHEREQARRQARDDRSPMPTFKKFKNEKWREQILREGFSADALRQFAGPENSLRTTRDLDRDGLTINAMGIAIPNQPYNPPPPPEQQDPWGLEEEGVVTQANRASRRLWLGLKYWDGMPVLRKATMLSKPTKRIWLGSRDLGGLIRGRAAFKGQVKPLTQVGEVMAVTTDIGVLDVRDAAERQIGGMVLCRVW